MDIRKLQRVIVNALEDVKAQDIKIFNTSKQTALFERVIVATANSNRQTRALGHHVFMEVKENGGDAVGIEGLETGEWVLVDCGSAIVHIMQPALRAYYNLEELWGGHPVRMKLLEDENKEDSRIKDRQSRRQEHAHHPESDASRSGKDSSRPAEGCHQGHHG